MLRLRESENRRWTLLAFVVSMTLAATGCGEQDDGAARTTQTAKPKVVRLDNSGSPIAPAALRLVDEVRAAAEQRSYDALRTLCDPCSDASFAKTQTALWRRGATIERFLAVLRTHPASTNGYTFPGFAFAGFRSDFDFADAKALGAPVPAAGVGPPEGYEGLMTSFEDPHANGTRQWTWNGMNEVG